VSNIKKTPLEHALDLIQAQKAWIMAVPDDTPLPAMPGFDREQADQLEAVLAEQVAFEKSLNTLPEHDALIKAITMCPHTIDAERVTLEWSGASPWGNTALNQLTTRIHEWKKQFSGPSFIDLRDMPDDQKHALMQNIKAKPAATMKMLHTYGDPPPVLVPDATPPKAPVVDCHATGVCVQSGLRAEKPAAWQPIETAPNDTLVMLYSPPSKGDWPDSIRITFDYIDTGIADGYWYHHGESYEHYLSVGKPEGSTGPSENAPYTHWMPLPPAPEATQGIAKGNS
jgi:hypothetical protein